MNRRANGFTLIELMIAMAVFAIAGVAVMRATTEHIRAMGIIEEMTMAGYVAENQLQLARLDTRWPPQPAEGEAEMAKNRWKWVLEVLETEDAEFRMLKVTVRPVEEPERVVSTLQTFIGRQRAE
ncbi:type II secretion system minor pseudopilin GspI [Rheinheimera texasensis]|uniref:type II secretion system minor pseudopilin GspI n=1 Tax=Rheinheimera texasensis TaxID=306205 RepID=UPI00068F2E94|nr:type II secretion system minor pseudopilin GspI [Rheinheimera texasensis]